MLRVFFLWTLPTSNAVAHLERDADAYRAALARLDAIDAAVPWDATGADLMSRLALEQGRRWAKTMAEWAAWAAEQVQLGHDATTLDGRMRASRR